MKNQILIHNPLNGEWEIAELVKPLVHRYPVGFTTVKRLQTFGHFVILPAPHWFDYFKFGFRFLFKMLWK